MNELIANLAEKLGVTPKALIITVIFFVAAFAVLWIKMTLDEKKGVDSKEKEEIRKIVGNLVPDGVQYTAAYAHSTEYQGRIRYYHYYAVGFRADQPDHIWVIPIGVEGDRIVRLHRACPRQRGEPGVRGRQFQLAAAEIPRKAEQLHPALRKRQQHQTGQGVPRQYPAA